MSLILTQRLSFNPTAVVQDTLSLTAEERTRSRHRFQSDSGVDLWLQLPRGTVLRDGDLLLSDDQQTLVRVIAKPEPVITVTARTPLDLLRAAYHLGNRHVSLEITSQYLRFAPDSVLQAMLEHLGLELQAEVQPFRPETGAYYQHHNH